MVVGSFGTVVETVVVVGMVVRSVGMAV